MEHLDLMKTYFFFERKVEQFSNSYAILNIAKNLECYQALVFFYSKYLTILILSSLCKHDHCSESEIFLIMKTLTIHSFLIQEDLNE